MSQSPHQAQPEPRVSSTPRHPIPPAACDAHAHVFGPPERFPAAGPTAYAPPLAPFGRYEAMLATVGVQRGVLVQPALYGTDVSALMDALGAGIARGWLRGIAAATNAVSDAELSAMHAAGVRGLRFVEMPDPRGGGRYAGAVGVEELRLLAPRLRELGWHAQIWARAEQHASLLPSLVTLGIPIVLDHMASFDVARGINDPSFRRVVDHLAAGEVWVKLPLCRNSQRFPDYPDIRGFHDALVAANPARLLWGSDWPHVRMTDTAPDVGHLLDLFVDWVDDARVRQMILVDNPNDLFQFDSVRALTAHGPHSTPETPNARH